MNIVKTSEGADAEGVIKMPTFTSTFSSTVMIDKWTDDTVSERVLRRRPALDGEVTVYTPNDLFFLFNKPDQCLHPTKLPWIFNTDENGGFQILWTPEGQDPYKFGYRDFVISKPMVDSLGLDPFMTAEIERYTNNIEFADDAFTSDQRYECRVVKQRLAHFGKTIDSLSEEFFTVDARTLVLDNGDPFVPQYPWPEELYMTGAIVTDADGASHRIPAVMHDGSKVGVVWVRLAKQRKTITREVKIYPVLETDDEGIEYYRYSNLPLNAKLGNTQMVSVESWSTYSQIDIVIPNLPFQPMLGSETDARILASLRLPFVNETSNSQEGAVSSTSFEYYGDLLYNSDSSRSYLKITTDQNLYDVDVEVRLIRRDGQMDILKLPYKGQFQIKLRFLQTQ